MGTVRAGVGHSTGTDGSEAGREALAAAVTDLPDDPTLVYVFASSEFDTTAVFEAIDAETDAVIAGTTTAGEIVNTSSYTESVGVLANALVSEVRREHAPTDRNNNTHVAPE